MATYKVSFSVKTEHLTRTYEIKAIKRGIQTTPVLLQDVFTVTIVKLFLLYTDGFNGKIFI